MAEVIAQERREGRMARRAEERAEHVRPVLDVPEIVFLSAAGASVIASLVLFLQRKKAESTFVGLWTAPIIAGSVLFELLRPSKR